MLLDKAVDRHCKGMHWFCDCSYCVTKREATQAIGCVEIASYEVEAITKYRYPDYYRERKDELRENARSLWRSVLEEKKHEL